MREANCPTGPRPSTPSVPPGGHIRVLHALPCRRQDVAEEQVAIIGQLMSDLVRVGLRSTHAQVLGLTAGD